MKVKDKYSGERRILNEGGERRGGNNPGTPGKRPAPPPPMPGNKKNSINK